MAFTFKYGDRPLEGYVIQRGVGRGGFGEVYYALSDSGREVALKYLSQDPHVEVRGVSQCMNLKSPNLVTIFDVKQNHEGDYFIIMEYVSGPSLRDLLIREPNGLGTQKAAFFLREIAKGLGFLHDRGIVHRDLKPGNIFYENGYVKIGDYGLSKFISVSRHSGQTVSVGTVHYMAPEVGTGNYHRGIDIYALGVILYEMLAGKVPFEGATMGEVLMKHLMEQPGLASIHPPFGDVIRKALAKDPKQRYQTVHEMTEAVFGVDDIRRSVAGFEPSSLTAAAGRVLPKAVPIGGGEGSSARAGLGQELPGGPARAPAESATDDADKGAKVGEAREEWAEKFGRRMDQFSRRMGRVGQHVGARAARVRSSAAGKFDRVTAKLTQAPFASAPSLGERIQRVVLALVVLVGLAVAIGMFTMGPWGQPGSFESGALTAGAYIAAMALSAIIGYVLAAKLSPRSAPGWVSRLVVVACSGPLILFARVLTEGYPGILPGLHPRFFGGFGPPGFYASGLATALLFVMVICNWPRRVQRGIEGKLELGSAITAGIAAFIITMFLREPLAGTAAGISAGASLLAQALAWFVAPTGVGGPGRSGDGAGRAVGEERNSAEVGPGYTKIVDRLGGVVEAGPGYARMVGPTGQEVVTRRPPGEPMPPPRAEPVAEAYVAPRARSTGAIVFWRLTAAILVSLGIILFIAPFALDMRDDEEVTLCAATGSICLSFVILALAKSTRFKRIGTWRETVRPWLISVCLAAAMTSCWCMFGLRMGDEVVFIALSVTVMAVVCALFVLSATGRRDGPLPQKQATPVRASTRRWAWLAMGLLVGLLLALTIMMLLVA